MQIYHVAFLLGKANHATILRTTKNIILHSFNKNLWTGIPAMAQWFQWHLCSSRTQAGSPGWHSGLQDPELPQLQIGHNCNSDLIPGGGTALVGRPKKRRRRRRGEGRGGGRRRRRRRRGEEEKRKKKKRRRKKKRCFLRPGKKPLGLSSRPGSSPWAIMLEPLRGTLCRSEQDTGVRQL